MNHSSSTIKALNNTVLQEYTWRKGLGEIPEDVVEKIREERRREYKDGFDHGIAFAKDRGYGVMSEILSKEDRMSFLSSEYEIQGTPDFMKGFIDALDKVLEETEQE